MADLLRAEDLPPGTRVHDPDIILVKAADDVWRPPGAAEAVRFCDRQVDILLDTGATIVADAPTPDSSLAE